MSDGLFDLPEPETPPTRGKAAALIAQGIHPFGGPTNPNHTCGDCTHRILTRHHNKTYPKCDISAITHGAGTDCRAWWPACHRWERKDAP